MGEWERCYAVPLKCRVSVLLACESGRGDEDQHWYLNRWKRYRCGAHPPPPAHRLVAAPPPAHERGGSGGGGSPPSDAAPPNAIVTHSRRRHPPCRHPCADGRPAPLDAHHMQRTRRGWGPCCTSPTPHPQQTADEQIWPAANDACLSLPPAMTMSLAPADGRAQSPDGLNRVGSAARPRGHPRGRLLVLVPLSIRAG